MENLKVGSQTNRRKIEQMLNINLSGWQAVGINQVDDNVLLWVNLESIIHPKIRTES